MENDGLDEYDPEPNEPDDEDEDTSPLIVVKNAEPTVQLSLPDDLTEKSSIDDAKRADVNIANDMLRATYFGFGRARSVQSITKLIETTLKVVEHRRKVLCLPYGSQNKNDGRESFDPDDS